MSTVFNNDTSDPRVVERLRRAGFLHASRIGNMPKYSSIITCLMERWRPETNSFHLPPPVCEATITPRDVSILLGLPTRGKVVCPDRTLKLATDVEAMINNLLPPSPNKLREQQMNYLLLGRLNNLLRSKEGRLRPNSTDDEVDRWTRCYILCLIGSVLMPDSSGGRVHSHFLSLLEDFDNCGKYSWGSAALAQMYRSLYHGCTRRYHYVGGSMTLLLSWFFYYFPRIAPTVVVDVEEDNEEYFPLSRR